MQLPPRRRLDRAAAAAIFGVAAIAMVVATAFGTIDLPLAARRDPRAAAQLVALMQRGESATFVADFVFTRTKSSGERFASDYSEARNSRFHLTRAGSSLDIDTARRHFDCALVDTGPSCSTRPRDKTLPDSEVMRIAVALGAYDVVSTGEQTILGERAHCFRVRARDSRHALEGLGFETDACYSADGLPLQTRVVSTDLVEERVARRVVRTFNAATIAPLLDGFDRTAPTIPN